MANPESYFFIRCPKCEYIHVRTYFLKHRCSDCGFEFKEGVSECQ
jgi:ribosomal protein S27E